MRRLNRKPGKALLSLCIALLAGASSHIQVCHAQQGDVFSAQGTSAPQGQFIIVGITAFNADTYDVKLKNPRTGYIHSITVHVAVIANLRVGDRVVEIRRGPEVALQPLSPSRPPPVQEPPPANYDPNKGPLTGYISNDPDAEPGAIAVLRDQLRQLDNGIDRIPGLPNALRFGARFTEEQRKELEKTFDLTKPHAGLKWVAAAILSEPKAIATITQAGKGSAAAYLAAKGSEEALAQAEKTAIEDLEKAAVDAVEAQKLPAQGPYPQWPPPPGTPESRLQRDVAANQEKYIERILTPGRYDKSPARAANKAMMRMLYRLSAAENQGQDIAALLDRALLKQGITGAEAEIDKHVILDNLTSLKKWGVLNDNANLLKLRGGGSPYSPVLNDRIDVIHTLPVKGAESLANKIYNLRVGPMRPNIWASNALNQTRLNFAKTLHDAGLMPDAAYESLLRMNQ